MTKNMIDTANLFITLIINLLVLYIFNTKHNISFIIHYGGHTLNIYIALICDSIRNNNQRKIFFSNNLIKCICK